MGDTRDFGPILEWVELTLTQPASGYFERKQ